MLRLGVCFNYGAGGVGVQLPKSVTWYRRAVDAPRPAGPPSVEVVEATYALAELLRCGGAGVAVNPTEAAQLYRAAADTGHSLAQYSVGMCLQRGFGVGRDPVEAVAWFLRAADCGDAPAQVQAGYCLCWGVGCAVNKTAAFVHYRRAAAAGYPAGLFHTAQCHRDGVGTPRDLVAAVTFFVQARDAGHPWAGEDLIETLPLLTPSQRASMEPLLRAPPPLIPPPPVGGEGAFGESPLPTKEEVAGMGTAALKRLLQGRGVGDIAGVVEKAKLVERALALIGEGQ